MHKAEFPLIGIFGGTFDPIHYGHLRVAEEVAETTGLQEIRFIPARIPRLRRAPFASPEHRTAMVRVAIEGNSRFILDEREIRRDSVSYSLETLRELKLELGAGVILCLIIGVDAFIRLPEWHSWRSLFNQCHFVIVARPGHPLTINPAILPRELAEECAQRWVSGEESLKHASNGLIFVAPTTLLDISATAIRAQISAGRSVRYLVPDAALSYIATNHLYSGEG